MKNRLLIAGAILVAVIIGVVVGITQFGEDSGKLTGNPLGVEAANLIPAEVGVVGPDGKKIVCPDGEPLMVPRSELENPSIGNTLGRFMAPRCGPDGEVVWVAVKK